MSEDGDDGTLVADFGVHGVWSPQSEALFDIRVTDTDAQSYLGHAPESILFRVETEKKQKYSAAANACRAHFLLLCFSVDGLAGSEATCYIKRLATRLSSKWERSYSEVLYWICIQIGVCDITYHWTVCKGTRSKWRCLGLEDGAGIIDCVCVCVFLFCFCLEVFC